jgi:hypothetical protein
MQNKPRFYWDVLIMLLAIFNCLTVPVQFAFKPDIFQSDGFKIINWTITGIFVLDLLVNMRTTYIDGREGEEIGDSKLMAIHYLSSGSFLLDLLSTIPFPDLFSSVAST